MSHWEKSRRTIFVAWFPVVAYAATIFFLSSLSLPSRPAGFRIPHLDKVVHFAEYAGFGFLLARAFFYSWPKRRTPRILAAAIFCATAFGIGDEIHQVFVPVRSPELLDIVADFFGASMGVFLYVYRRSRHSSPASSVGASLPKDQRSR